ncbi:MAG: helix-turn-helix transcriptional regulator [Acidobacteria bacterium]|nr:helix-turn-helix transcriptional regulator [Acidobacteriota bacterium]
MDAKTHAKLETRARIMRALAHPSRLFMIEQLAGGERCVCELTEMVGSDISTVSKHLSILKSEGIVRDEKRGAQVFYSITDFRVLRFVRQIELLLAHMLENQMKAADVPQSRVGFAQFLRRTP